MKTNLKTKLVAVALLLNATLFSQQTYFTTPNYKFNTTSSTLVGSSLITSGTQGTYNLANGCYDNNNNLLFYVTDQGVYSTSGSIVGYLGYPGYSNVWNPRCGCYVNHFYDQLASTEIEIVPIPGTCKNYYVIYAMQVLGSGNKLCYIKVDCSSGSPVITYNGTTTANSVTANAAFDLGVQGNDGTNIGIAVSQIISGSGSSATRYLYTAGTYGSGSIQYRTISNTGISSGNNMAFSVSGVSYNTSELELSPDGNWLAWTSAPNGSPANNKIYIGKLSFGTSFVSSPYQWVASTTNTTFKGLEFAAGGNPLLYLAGSNGLSYVQTSTQSQPTTFSSSSYDFTNTFLEIGKNGQIYGVSKTTTTQHLVGINTSNQNLTGLAVSFDSRYNISNGLWANGIYTLPEQVDGQNYNDFNGQPVATINTIDVNGVNAVCAAEPTYYNCSAITLNATYIGTPSSYKIDIVRRDDECSPIYGTGIINYVGSWTSGSIPTALDLKTLTDGAGVNLGNITNGGSNCYKITVSVKDVCNNISTKTTFIKVLTAVTPVLGLEVYQWNGISNTYVNASQSISSPINSGALSTGIRITNTNLGTVTNYNVTIDQVDGVYGNVTKNIFNTTFPVNITSATPVNFNSLCVNSTVWSPTTPGGGACTSTSPSYSGYTGYFGYSNGLLSYGNYYKYSVTLSNPCSNTTNYSFVYINDGYAKVAGISNNKTYINNSTIYPNPATDKVNFSVNSQTTDAYSITVYDIVGKQVATVVNNKLLVIGENTVEFNTSTLVAGVYTYKISTGTITKSGLLSITK